jgi:glycosyltransferase involved in cell wall biosynthesis
MRVLFIARNYPPHIGGAERLNYELAQNLQKFVDVDVLPNRFGKYSPIFHVYSVFKILLNRDKFDIVLLSDAYLAPIIPIIKKTAKKPVVIKVHGLDITVPNKIYQFFIPKFVNMADNVICISKATKEECIKRGISPDKCKVILIGIDKKRQKTYIHSKKADGKQLNITNEYVLLFVGRLVKRKGIHWFVENVIPKLVEKDKDFIYLIAGDGPYRKVIENIISEKELEKYVRILGKVSDEDLELLYNIADIFIMPNIPVEGDMEGFGIVILEASSHGVPVIASNLEGIRDAVVNGKTGILVEPLNPDMFAREILKMIEAVRENRKIKKKIRRMVLKRYGWSKISQKYYSTFALLTKKTNGGFLHESRNSGREY